MIKTIETQLSERQFNKSNDEMVTLRPEIAIEYQHKIRKEIAKAIKNGFAPPGLEKVNQIMDPLELGMLFVQIIDWCFDNGLDLEIIESETAVIYLDIVRSENHYDKDEIKELRGQGYNVEVLKPFKSYASKQLLITYTYYLSEMRKNKCIISIPVSWAIMKVLENDPHKDLFNFYAAIIQWEDLIEGEEGTVKQLTSKLLSSS
jgi:hypothetical protein